VTIPRQTVGVAPLCMGMRLKETAATLMMIPRLRGPERGPLTGGSAKEAEGDALVGPMSIASTLDRCTLNAT